MAGFADFLLEIVLVFFFLFQPNLDVYNCSLFFQWIYNFDLDLGLALPLFKLPV